MKEDSPLLDKSEILLIDKPAGISSFGVVARVRRKLSEKSGWIDVKGKDGVVRQKQRKVKVGHTGTLDPFATGLLILLVGKGTKKANEFLKLDKEYEATIRLGKVSSTGDPEGEIRLYQELPECSCREKMAVRSVVTGGSEQENLEISDTQESIFEIPSLERVEEVLKGLTGEIEQRVPNFSAVKINGQRAYKLAREGKMIEMPVRKVKVYKIEILEYKWPELSIRCQVSSGTYIRALGEDIGKALGVGGYLTALRRTQVGKYRVEEAVKLEEFEKTAL